MLKNKDRKGFILIASYMVIVVLLILGAAFILRSVTEARIAEREKKFVQVLYLAEAGIDQGLQRLRTQHSAENPGLADLGAGTYDYETTNLGGDRFRIVSTGTVGDISRTVIAEFQADTFARYAYFTDDEHFRWWWWQVPVWFITGDYLGGPVETNSHLHIYGDPVFADPDGNQVKSADDFITYMNGGPPNPTIDSSSTSNPPHDNPDFQHGIEFNTETVNLPTDAPDLENNTTSGYQFTASSGEPAQILLSVEEGLGKMTVTDQTHTNETMNLPANGAVFVSGGNVEVSGTLAVAGTPSEDAGLSIGCNRNIVVTDSILYNDDPRVNSSSPDKLGLIAEQNVVVSEDAPHDVQIDASIMALGSSFTVENWSQEPAKGTLTLYGGLIQERRGPVGTFDPDTGTRQSGYSKDYQYDSRLGLNPPPFFPHTGGYVILSWEEQ